MSNVLDCGQCCDTPDTVSVPGATGASSISLTTANFVIPAVGANVVVPVTTTSWMSVGLNVFVGGANFKIASFDSGANTVTLTNLGFTGDTAVNTIVVSGTLVSAGVGNVAELSGVNALTDNSTGTAGDTIAAGVGIHTLIIPYTFPTGTAVAEPITTYLLGFKFKILAWSWTTTVISAGAAASRVLNMEINAVDVGTVVSTITATLASTDTVGEQTAGTAVSGANTGGAADTFSIELQTGGTQFTTGPVGFFTVRVQNVDEADAIASIAAKVNSLIAASLT